MAELPDRASVVVIGAGIVGNSLVHHLAELGWTDIVQLDKGPLPNPGGSTGHASNFIFPVDHNREIAEITLDSMRQYKEMGVFTESGGIEVARTEERMEELRRRMSSAKDWGIESRLVTPEEVQELVPFLDPSVIIGGFYTPSVGVVDSLDDAVSHIRAHSSGHTEAIVTSSLGAARSFTMRVDAAAVMVNASTRFTDGGEFGFGAEIGISTQKLHARGPMALPELTTTTWIVEGDGQVRG